MRADGQPFFWVSDLAQELIVRTTREEADLYLRDRAEKGYTVIFMGALAYFTKDKPVPNLFNNVKNMYGAVPFANGDFSRPNPDYFSYLDWVIERARHYQLRVALYPVVGLLTATTGLLTVEKAHIYGKWLGTRYRGRGIIWVLGGDLTPLFRPIDPKTAAYVGNVVDFRPVMDSLAAGISEGEARHPVMTYHPSCCSWAGTAEPRTSLYLGDRA
jgi:hypothetical protein